MIMKAAQMKYVERSWSSARETWRALDTNIRKEDGV